MTIEWSEGAFSDYDEIINYSIIYTLIGERIIIVSFWNNRKNPDTLHNMLDQME